MRDAHWKNCDSVFSFLWRQNQQFGGETSIMMKVDERGQNGSVLPQDTTTGLYETT